MGHKLRSFLVAAVVVGPLVCQPGNEAAFVGAAAREDIPDDWLGLEVALLQMLLVREHVDEYTRTCA